MSKTVSAVDARRTFGDLLNRVTIANEEIIIERAGKKVAKLVSCEQQPQGNRNEGKLDFRTSAGLGREVWQAIDLEKYLKTERQEWE